MSKNKRDKELVIFLKLIKKVRACVNYHIDVRHSRSLALWDETKCIRTKQPVLQHSTLEEGLMIAT